MNDEPSKKPLAAPDSGSERDVFLILEGGGVKGIAHIGAYRAIEETRLPEASAAWPRLNISGVAGSSVGALVAALIAVGYRADELISANGRLVLARTLNIRTPHEVFRDKGMQKLLQARSFLFEQFGALRLIVSFISNSIIVAATVIFLCLFVLSTIALLFRIAHNHTRYEIAQATLSVGEFSASTLNPLPIIIENVLSDVNQNAYSLAVVFFIVLALYLFRSLRILAKGLVAVQDLERVVERALALKVIPQMELEANRNPERGEEIARDIAEARQQGILFKHLKYCGRRLRIVATDIRRGAMKSFSRSETPTICISKAVAASIAIPMVFKKQALDGSVYQDGGLVSNLPAWAYSSHHALDPDSLIIAIKLESDDSSEVLGNRQGSRAWRLVEPFYELFYGTLYSALFGRSAIDARDEGRTAVLTIRTELGLLDFDALMDIDLLKTAIDQSVETTRIKLEERICRLPARQQALCDEVARKLSGLVPRGDKAKRPLVRVAIAKPHRSGDFLQIVFGRQYRELWTPELGREWMHDDRILLPTDSSVSGASLESGTAQFELGERLTRRFQLDRDRYQRWMKAAVAIEDRPEWVWAIPVYRASELAGDGKTLEHFGVSKGPSRCADLVLCIECNIASEIMRLDDGMVRWFYEQEFVDLVFDLMEEERLATENIEKEVRLIFERRKADRRQRRGH